MSISIGDEFYQRLVEQMRQDHIQNKSRFIEERLRDGLEVYNARKEAAKRKVRQ